MEIITASSLTDLREALETVPDNVPPRGLGRLTEHTEPWIMKRIVASLAASGFLRFPIIIELSDRPDIVIHSDGQDIGVELMELVPPAYAQAVAIANKEFPEAIVDRSVFGWGTTWAGDDIRQHLKAEGHRLSGHGWVGDAVEREWAGAVCCAIDKKTERLNRTGFGHHSENWLGTYASSPGPAFNVEVGTQYVGSSDLVREQFQLNFDAAVNLVSNSVVVLSKEGIRVCPHISV